MTDTIEHRPFEAFLNQVVSLADQKEQEVQAWQKTFWNLFGKPDNERYDYEGKLGLMPLSWLLRVDEDTPLAQKPLAALKQNLPTELQPAASAFLLTQLHLILLPKTLMVDGRIDAKYGSDQRPLSLVMADISPTALHKCAAILGFISPWQGSMYLLPGFETLQADALKVAQEFTSQKKMPYRAKVHFLYRFAHSIFNYPQGDFLQLLDKLHLSFTEESENLRAETN